MLLTAFLAGCEFFFNDIEVSFAKYKTFTFPKHPRLQKVCRLLFVVVLILALFAQVGYWRQATESSFWDYFANLMVVLVIYYILCYSCVICILWGISVMLKILRLLGFAIIWIADNVVTWIISWINGK